MHRQAAEQHLPAASSSPRMQCKHSPLSDRALLTLPATGEAPACSRPLGKPSQAEQALKFCCSGLVIFWVSLHSKHSRPRKRSKASPAEQALACGASPRLRSKHTQAEQALASGASTRVRSSSATERPNCGGITDSSRACLIAEEILSSNVYQIIASRGRSRDSMRTSGPRCGEETFLRTLPRTLNYSI
jgi:hypothetical protein